MGAEWFEQYADGKDMEDAFQKGVQAALFEYGHRGYTGTMAEKGDFVDMTADFPKFSTIQEVDAILATIYGIPNIVDNNTVEVYTEGKIVKRATTDKEKEVIKIAKVAFEKWGPAVGIRLPDGFNANAKYLFFGMASS